MKMNRRTYGPLLWLWAFTLIGLLSALVGDGPYDWLSWLTLAAPVAASIYSIVDRRGGREKTGVS